MSYYRRDSQFQGHAGQERHWKLLRDRLLKERSLKSKKLVIPIQALTAELRRCFVLTLGWFYAWPSSSQHHSCLLHGTGQLTTLAVPKEEKRFHFQVECTDSTLKCHLPSAFKKGEEVSECFIAGEARDCWICAFCTQACIQQKGHQQGPVQGDCKESYPQGSQQSATFPAKRVGWKGEEQAGWHSWAVCTDGNQGKALKVQGSIKLL